MISALLSVNLRSICARTSHCYLQISVSIELARRIFQLTKLHSTGILLWQLPSNRCQYCTQCIYQRIANQTAGMSTQNMLLFNARSPLNVYHSHPFKKLCLVYIRSICSSIECRLRKGPSTRLRFQSISWHIIPQKTLKPPLNIPATIQFW